MPNGTFEVFFYARGTASAPVKDGARLTFSGTDVTLEGEAPGGEGRVLYGGTCIEDGAAMIAHFTSRNQNPATPFVLKSFAITEADRSFLVGGFWFEVYESSVPPDDVGSYVAVEPDGTGG